MHSLSVSCEKHPDLVFSLTTGVPRMEYVELDEKGKATVWWKDMGAQESFIRKVVDHFTSCDGQMIKGGEQIE